MVQQLRRQSIRPSVSIMETESKGSTAEYAQDHLQLGWRDMGCEFLGPSRLMMHLGSMPFLWDSPSKRFLMLTVSLRLKRTHPSGNHSLYRSIKLKQIRDLVDRLEVDFRKLGDRILVSQYELFSIR